jgi:putative ABC transport system permease protein
VSIHSLKSLLRRRRSHDGLDEEIRAHLDEAIERLVASGLSLEEATAQARRQFGNRTAVLENSRDEWAIPLDHIAQDLRYAARTLARNPLFAAAVVLPLGLGIGANTAIFTVVNAALLRPLPYYDPARLVHLWEFHQNSDRMKSEASYPDYLDWKTATRFFDGVAGYQSVSATLNLQHSPEQVLGAMVSIDFFSVLGTQAAAGRTFLVGEDRPGASRVAVLSDSLWRRLGADPAILGRTIILSDQPFTVIGVLPAQFQFAMLGNAEVWMPLVPSRQQQARRYWHWLNVIARMKPGATESQARAELAAIGDRIARSDPSRHAATGLRMVPLRQEIVGDIRPVLLILMGAIGLVLLLACANVANLILVRSSARRREIAVRGSLGASRGRLVRQLLTESLLLASGGGALGLVVAREGVRLLIAAIPANMRSAMPYLEGLTVDGPILAFTAVVSLLTGLLFGLTPALRLSHASLYESLKQGRGTSAGGDHQRLRRLLLIGEIAISTVLLTSAGLMMKSTVRLLRVNPGFDPDRLLTMAVSLPPLKYAQPAQIAAFHNELLRRLESLPGITGAASVSVLPLSGGGNNGNLHVVDRAEPPGAATPVVNVRTIAASYFHTLGIPLLAGRFFTDHDNAGAPKVVLINQRLAREVFPGQDPLGRRIAFEWSPGPWQIVGIAADENTVSLDVDVRPVVYFPYLQDPDSYFKLAVRSAGPAEHAIDAVRETVRSLDPDVPVYAFRTMEQLIADAPYTFMRRYPAFLIGIFAAVALLLAAIGIYGLVAYTVAQRTREIGIRIALGAQRRDILELVMLQGLLMIAAGMAIGLAAASLLARALRSVLFGVSPTDAPTFLIAVAVLAAAALAACYVPARRAMRVSPAQTLAAE